MSDTAESKYKEPTPINLRPEKTPNNNPECDSYDFYLDKSEGTKALIRTSERGSQEEKDALLSIMEQIDFLLKKLKNSWKAVDIAHLKKEINQLFNSALPLANNILGSGNNKVFYKNEV